MARASLVFAVVASLLAGCVAPSPPAVPGTPPASASTVRVEAVATGLEVPWGLAFAPDGRIFVTERMQGTVRVVQDGVLLPEPIARFPVAARGEAGLLGIALDPSFADNQLVYVMYTYPAPDVSLLNRVVRFRADQGEGSAQVLVDQILGGINHDGGRVKFGPDGKLYITTGEAGNPALAQVPTGLNGKLLRLNPDGTIPADNPTPGSPVWTLGHRNPQGLAWDLQGWLWSTEHGPSGGDGPGGFDELNLLQAGSNYGWPGRYCDQQRAPLLGQGVAPVFCSEEAIAPAGLAVLNHSRYPGWAPGDLFFGTLRGQHLHRIALDGGGSVAAEEALFAEQYGRIRDVAIGADGWLYFTTSNRDGRGTPRDGDDHVYRIVAG